MFEVEVRNVAGETAAVANAGPYTLVVDRPADGGRGVGFNDGTLLYLAIAGCVSNDPFREACAKGISLDRVRVTVRGDFSGDPAVSTDVTYDIELTGDASRANGSSNSSRRSMRSRRSRIACATARR